MSIASRRTHKSLEVIFSNNMEIRHIKGMDNSIVDYLLRMRQSTQDSNVA